jgi:hypothetical protein
MVVLADEKTRVFVGYRLKAVVRQDGHLVSEVLQCLVS